MNNQARLLLLLCTSASCFCSSPPSAAQAAQSEPAFKVTHVVNDRLEIPHQTQPLKLGEENEVAILLHGHKANKIYARFDYMDDQGNPLFTGAESEAAITYHSMSDADVKVVPEQLGKAKLHFEVRFEDGAVQAEVLEIETVLPEDRPKEFLVERGGGTRRTSGTLYLGLSGLSNHATVGPMAIYPTSTRAVPIPASLVRFKLTAANNDDPPISLDETSGKITALHIGHALIESTFEGFSDLTCVDVMQNASDGGDRTNCHELVPAGMTPPESGIDLSKPPSKVKVPPQP
jgi:hypothetical protein